MRFPALLVATSLALAFLSCGNSGTVAPSYIKGGTEYAERFAIEKRKDYYLLSVLNPWQNTEKTYFTYYLAGKDVILPDSIPEESIIRIPVSRVVCMSVTHVAMLDALDMREAIVGISGKRLIYNPKVNRDLSSGKISDVGYDNNIDKELILSLQPDLLIAYGVTESSSEYLRRLGEMGVRILFDADYLEDHPLARMEWIKVMGILTGREKEADSIFNSVAFRYNSLADRVKENVLSKPMVLLGAPWEDVWYVSPSNSYIVKLIYDAGGTYIFSDLQAGNAMPFSVETVFSRASDADIWLNPGVASSLNEIKRDDHRLALLPAYMKGNIWNNRKRMTPSGGNDYWEGAVVNPDILLRDIVVILHPELEVSAETVYFTKLR